MTYTRDQIASWLDAYFEVVNSHQGEVESVVELRKYFADDFVLWMYTTVNRPIDPPQTREQLLLSFVHPGLLEELVPNYYAIDVTTMVAVVQFAIIFRDLNAGRDWPTLQASAHYHLRPDGAGGIQIGRINYWTQRFTDEYRPMFELWWSTRDKALAEFGSRYLETGAAG